MNVVVTALLALLAKLVPAIAGNTSTIQTIINALIEILPVLVQEYKDVLPFIKNIIAVLQGDDAVTQEQLAQLSDLDAQVDAAFEIAAAAAQAEDDAADKS